MDKYKKGITGVGVLIVIMLVVILGVVGGRKLGLFEKIPGGEILDSVVPIPESSDIKSVKQTGKNISNLVTRSGGFDFDQDTPGYENFLELRQGCPRKDCIVSIDDPSFQSIEKADKNLDSDDIVFVLEYKGVVRAYPQNILNSHEIVNDILSGDPLAVTFCPLCGSALAFDRRLDGKVLEFGVSGKLHNNDLVMYDRNTESLWQQITGEAIVGELFESRLEQISLSGMRWKDFVSEFPEAQVLVGPRGDSAYDYYPYGDYESSNRLLFPMDNFDETIHPKTVVYGVGINDSYKAYPIEKIEAEQKIDDTVGDVDIVVSWNGGDVVVNNVTTDEEIVATRLFWFAWKAFREDTDLYDE